MARIRSIKPEFWTDSKMVRHSRDARLFYVGTWNFALCDNGHLHDDPVQLKMQIFPADDDVSVPDLIEELVQSGRMVRLWSDDGRAFLQVRKLTDHQKLERRWSPRCPACQADHLSETPATSPKLPETPATPLELFQPRPTSAEEGKGGEGKGEKSVAPAGAPASMPTTANGGTVVRAWVDALRTTGVEPSKSQIGQVGKLAKELLEKNDPTRVLEAARAAGGKGFASIDRELTAMAGKSRLLERPALRDPHSGIFVER